MHHHDKGAPALAGGLTTHMGWVIDTRHDRLHDPRYQYIPKLADDILDTVRMGDSLLFSSALFNSRSMKMSEPGSDEHSPFARYSAIHSHTSLPGID